MSIPMKDPSFTMDDLRAEGEKFLEAGIKYWEACHKAGIGGAVIWLEALNGNLVIFTRGEYRDTLLNNITRTGPTVQFGALQDE